MESVKNAENFEVMTTYVNHYVDDTYHLNENLLIVGRLFSLLLQVNEVSPFQECVYYLPWY